MWVAPGETRRCRGLPVHGAAVHDRRYPAQRAGKTQPRAEAAEADALGSNRRTPRALKGEWRLRKPELSET